MEEVLSILSSVTGIVDTKIIVAIAGAVIAVIVILIVLLVIMLKRKSFYNFLKVVLENPERASEIVSERYSTEELLKKSRLIERFAKENGSEIVELTGMDTAWIDRVYNRKGRRDFIRVMKYAREKGLFTCFAVSLENEKLARLFRDLIGTFEKPSADGSGEITTFLPLRELALAGKGESFDGKKALELFRDRLDEIREMTGYPEWQARYFAIKILVHDGAEKSKRAVFESFEDPYPLVRKTVVLEFARDSANSSENDRKDIYGILYGMVLDDPSHEVRSAAWSRIKEDFKDLHKPDYGKLKEEQLLHALEILEPDSEADENLALSLLGNKNREVRYYASRFLERAGSLKKLLLQCDFGDREMLERNYGLLKAASETNTVNFLSTLESTDNPAALYTGCRILKETGPREIITTIAERIFRVAGERIEESGGSKDSWPLLYDSLLEAIGKRGNDKALYLLREELNRERGRDSVIGHVLSAIPERADFIFLDSLFRLVTDKTFTDYDSLKTAFAAMKPELYIDRLTEIVESGRGKYPHEVRIKALKLLGEVGDMGSLQFILENLSVLPVDEAKDFARTLAHYAGEDFKRKAMALLNNIDSSLRAALIAALPATKDKDFLKPIKKSLDDSDPQVRIASAWAIADFAEYKSLNLALELLRDPVPQVREEIARIIGSYGLSDALKKLRSTLTDQNEVSSVKISAIQGLGRSKSVESINIILDAVESEKSLREHAVKALSRRRSKKDLERLIESFKDASPDMRDVITEAFKLMGSSIEEGLSELLKEDIPSLRPYIVEAMEATGFIEAKIRQLRHRDADVRKKAASMLSLIGSLSAFRGIVLASRDPNREVRVQVVKALEKLETEDGKKILDELLNDPDKKVRTYTLWAMERLKAKSL